MRDNAAMRPEEDHGVQQVTADALRDPVCGMSVTMASEHRVEHAGTTFYFCCAGCRCCFVSMLSRLSWIA